MLTRTIYISDLDEELTFKSLDIVLMIWGTVGAMGHGVILPAFSFIFGELLDAFNKVGDEFLDEILRIALNFIYAGIGALVAYYGL